MSTSCSLAALTLGLLPVRGEARRNSLRARSLAGAPASRLVLLKNEKNLSAEDFAFLGKVGPRCALPHYSAAAPRVVLRVVLRGPGGSAAE